MSNFIRPEQDDPRRDGGFTLFYMGINIGALIPPIFAGDLVHQHGWHSGFLLAAVGMLIGLISFIYGRYRLQGKGGIPKDSPLYRQLSTYFNRVYFLLACTIVICAFIIHALFKIPTITSTVLIIASILIVFWVLIIALRESDDIRNKMIAALILTVISVGFWALYNQTFTSLMLFAERNMQPNFLGMTINAEFTQFFNPFFIILLSPILSQLWLKLDRFKLNPSTPNKFFLSTIFMLFGFMILAFATRYLGQNGMVSAGWLVASYFLQTVGELLISPIGLAMITVLVPRHLVGMMMGVWFLSQAAAFSFSGFLATISVVPEGLSVTQSLFVYAHAFYQFSWVGLGLCIVTLALIIPVRKLINN
ncbi:Dipeptide and tripeptide permease B [Piscirickettsia salmonis]|uniref:H+ symporter family protein n=2 Tax=Piscirickettsia salmonis TaxID=1238 RepID=A0AAC8VJB3_PISSA|nr:oligopeptide:H+ symporter [Piscirickettsia salmonis]ALB23530.1 H+ symporter family protein [Piscirickettsia salmonis]KLV35596.1 hypothetical protein AB894_07595 [Piscirickettsia salmonis]QGN97878.1 Dipeptide and tripeptide permease B [Piscirickettsia salmonis]QGO01481.1 Dipeptide and tripeptide permease B [Piscirickettsia salmonis]QGO12195.1 Dipeptide and tripeptide permease B [Piscirickettsia salmonis]